MTSAAVTRRVVLGLGALLASTASGQATAPGPAEALLAVGRRTGNVFVPHARPPVGEADRTLAPYFFVPGDGAADLIPLKETTADVDIAGVIAQVTVRQVYENHAKTPIEAIYVFPASTRAAVHGMRMKIGARTIEARIDRREQARSDYEQAKSEGRRASLLEQERENVFSMSVANLMPGDRIEVELRYSELLVPEEAVYEFVYPTVVGPRYGGGADADRDRWISSPYQQQGQPEAYRFDLQMHLETSIPLKDVSSPSHGIDVTYGSPGSADVRLQKAGGGNRDFIVRYRLAGDRIETGLMLWEGQDGGTFALMMEPPRRPDAAQIPPREFVFLVDVSGSMNGFPIETAKSLMRDLLSSLRASDRFNIVLFAGASEVLSLRMLSATQANIRTGVDWVDRQQGGGGTELMQGLATAYALGDAQAGVARTVVAITDGFVGVESQAFRFIREHLDESNLFAFGIGTSVNRALIEGMARAGAGEPYVVLRPDKATEQAERFRKAIDRPVLTDIRVKMRGLSTHDVLPDKVPDLLAGRPIVVLGRYRGRPTGTIEVSGATGGKPYRQTVEVRASDVRAEHEPLRWLWARRWVATLEDELVMGDAPELKDAITNLGLSHSLLTRFTSFVAVDSEQANRSGQAMAVRQPLPMPEGVSNLAVGAMSRSSAMSSGPRMRRKVAERPYGSGGGGHAAMADGDGIDQLLLGAASRPAARQRAVSPELRVVALGSLALEGGDAVRQAVLAQLRAHPCAFVGEVRLRLTIDSTGKVIAVDVLSGKARCLIARLLGLATSGRSRARDRASIDLSFRTR